MALNSVNSVKAFLKCVKKHFPSNVNHNLTLENDNLVLTLYLIKEWRSFHLDENDLSRDPEDVILDLKVLLEKE